jgi:hypothetical protein
MAHKAWEQLLMVEENEIIPLCQGFKSQLQEEDKTDTGQLVTSFTLNG